MIYRNVRIPDKLYLSGTSHSNHKIHQAHLDESILSPGDIVVEYILNNVKRITDVTVVRTIEYDHSED